MQFTASSMSQAHNMLHIWCFEANTAACVGLARLCLSPAIYKEVSTSAAEMSTALHATVLLGSLVTQMNARRSVAVLVHAATVAVV
jgi:hypothetical protein